MSVVVEVTARAPAGFERLVANVLEEPFGRNLPPESLRPRGLVDPPRHRVELCALQVARCRPRELVARLASCLAAGHESLEIDELVGHRDAVAALAFLR